jgi:hypothetical protein
MRVFGLPAGPVVGLLFFPSPVLGFAPSFKVAGQLTTRTLLRRKQQHESSSSSSSSSSSLNAALVLSPSILSVGSVAASASSSSDQHAASSSSSLSSVQDQPREREQEQRDAQIQKQGGLFTVRTKFGALNPYAVYYGTVSILLGIPWFLALTAYQLFAFITRDKLDKNRAIPVFLTHIWGTLLLRLTRSYPTFENQQVLVDFFKEYVRGIIR